MDTNQEPSNDQELNESSRYHELHESYLLGATQDPPAFMLCRSIAPILVANKPSNELLICGEIRVCLDVVYALLLPPWVGDGV